MGTPIHMLLHFPLNTLIAHHVFERDVISILLTGHMHVSNNDNQQLAWKIDSTYEPSEKLTTWSDTDFINYQVI